MSASQKLLVIGGLLLALWGMGYGLSYAVFSEHQTLDRMGSALATGFVRAAERNMAGAGVAIAAYANAEFVYVRQVDGHGHWIGLGMLLIVLGLAFDRVGFDERKKLFLAEALLAGAVIFPLGVLLETANRGAGPKAIAVVGSALVIAALAGIAFGFSREGERG